MADTDSDVKRTRRQLFDLEARVYALESVVIRTFALVTGGLLVLGSVLPVFTDSTEDGPVRLVTAPFEIFGSIGENEDDEAFGVVMGIGFLGLLACVFIAVVICFAQWSRLAGYGSARTAKVVAWLLLIGMLVPVYFTFAAANSEYDDIAGPAMWFLVPGVIAFAVTVFNDYLRGLWCPNE